MPVLVSAARAIFNESKLSEIWMKCVAQYRSSICLFLHVNASRKFFFSFSYLLPLFY